MYRNMFSLLKGLFLILCFICTVQCAPSPPSKFYLITPLPETPSKIAAESSPGPITVRIDTIQVPGYLDRPEIVTRVSENEIDLADFNQWGESLRSNLTDVVAANLSRLLSPDCYLIFPFKCPTTPDYRVNVEILRMDGPLGGKVHLTAQWSILQGDNNRILASRKFRRTGPETASDYSALVASESRLVTALSRKIAAHLPPCP